MKDPGQAVHDRDIELHKLNPTNEDANTLLSVVKKAGKKVGKHIAWVNVAKTKQNVLTYLQDYGDKFYGIYVKSELVGMVGFSNFDSDGRAEISYWLIPSARGRGIASRAVAMLENISFHDMGFKTLELGIMSDNTDSLKLAKKLNYVLDYSYKFPGNRTSMSFVKTKEMWQNIMIKNQGLNL